MIDLNSDKNFLELKKSFDAYYEKVLRPKLVENDKIRRRYFFMFLILVMMVVVFYPLILWAVLSADNENLNVLGFIIGLSGGIIILLRSPIYFFNKKAKNTIMADFANFFGSFSYYHERCLPDELLQESELFKSYNSHKGDDYFCGTYKDVKITISEELLQKESVYFSETQNQFGEAISKQRHVKKKKIFRGICILLTMNKNFVGRTVVLKDKGLFNVFKQISGLQRVKLEDMYFEDLFEVYSSNQIEARYLLTTAFMERMLKLTELYGGKSIQFSFKDNQLLLAVPTKQDMFEACSFFRSNVNKKKIDNVFQQFYIVFSVVDILKLNQRTGF